MSNFIVSARKYRPATFDTVVGQHSITTTLKNAIKNNHLAQAFLFCGPRGVGKTTCARILAKTINCQNLTANTEACDQCESCVSFRNQQSFNIYELDAASNNSVDDIRGLVDQVRVPPHTGKYKIYIIDEVHMLSTSAFNAFLKTLEEPPSYAIFILATTEKHKILPTILSRCQIFDFNRIRIEDIATHLAYIAEKESITADPDALHIIAQKADGALRDSLSMFDQIVSFAGNNITYESVIDNLNVLDYDYYFKLTDFILQSNLPSALLLFNDILAKGFDGHNFINGLSSHFRDILVCKDEATLKLLEVSPGIKQKYKEQSAKCSVPMLLGLLDICNKADMQYKSAKNQRLHVELGLMKMSSILRTDLQLETSDKKKTSVAEGNTPPVTSNFVVTEVKPEYKKPASGTRPGAMGTISISSMLKGGNTSEIATKKIEEPIADFKRPTEGFSFDQLHIQWTKYAEILLKSGKQQLHSTMSKRKPELDGTKIVLTIDNKVQEENISAEKVEILGFLRKELKNYDISLETKLAPQEDNTGKAYTESDKFKLMLEKNPALNTLRKNLGLDFF